jgi:hypothetical protein
MSFFDVMSEVHKDSEDVSAGIGNFFKSDTEEFCPEFDVKFGKANFDLAQLINIYDSYKYKF